MFVCLEWKRVVISRVSRGLVFVRGVGNVGGEIF